MSLHDYGPGSLQGQYSGQYGNALSAISQPTVRETLTQRLAKAKQEVAEIEEALDLLNKNPDLQRLIDLLRGKY